MDVCYCKKMFFFCSTYHIRRILVCTCWILHEHYKWKTCSQIKQAWMYKVKTRDHGSLMVFLNFQKNLVLFLSLEQHFFINTDYVKIMFAAKHWLDMQVNKSFCVNEDMQFFWWNILETVYRLHVYSVYDMCLFFPVFFKNFS